MNWSGRGRAIKACWAWCLVRSRDKIVCRNKKEKLSRKACMLLGERLYRGTEEEEGINNRALYSFSSHF